MVWSQVVAFLDNGFRVSKEFRALALRQSIVSNYDQSE